LPPLSLRIAPHRIVTGFCFAKPYRERGQAHAIAIHFWWLRENGAREPRMSVAPKEMPHRIRVTSSRQLSASTDTSGYVRIWRETVEVTPKILLNIRQVTETTGISRASIYRQMKAGQLPFVKLGSRTLFRPADLQDFVDRNLQVSD
jgi:excisionase family DNA binding protein